MNIRSFYEHVVLRDVLAYTLPGAVVLWGITLMAQAFGWGELAQIVPGVVQETPLISVTLLIFVAFLLGHLVDMLYRHLFQVRDWYRRPDVSRKCLLGDKAREGEAVSSPAAAEVRKAVG